MSFIVLYFRNNSGISSSLLHATPLYFSSFRKISINDTPCAPERGEEEGGAVIVEINLTPYLGLPRPVPTLPSVLAA